MEVFLRCFGGIKMRLLVILMLLASCVTTSEMQCSDLHFENEKEECLERVNLRQHKIHRTMERRLMREF